VASNSLWITGSAKSGKTEALIAQLEEWRSAVQQSSPQSPARARLVFAANSDNRSVLVRRIAQAARDTQATPQATPQATQDNQAGEALISTTPFAFFESEVQLFWPLVIQQLELRGYFPYRLRPEAEQELALKLWNGSKMAALQAFEPGSLNRWGHRILDLIQLAASSGTPLEDLALKLTVGDDRLKLPADIAALIQQLALEWKDWCLHRGILTYGLVTDLFGQCLLKHETYLKQLPQRFSIIAADDVDNYPKIVKVLFERGLDLGLRGIFTYSPTGSIRKGLGADPEAFLDLRDRCTQIDLPEGFVLQPFDEAGLALNFPDRGLAIYTLQTVSRNQLLQDVAQHIVTALQIGSVQPQDIAIIGPGLDPIARYTLIDSLQRHGIPVEPLREQRPLQSSTMVRALLTLLALVYPGLGRWLEAEQIAEMLVVLAGQDSSSADGKNFIDPVRAGLLADYCFRPHPEQPELLPIESYLRWDRLGYSAAQAYERIRQWIAQQRGTLHRSTPQHKPAAAALSAPALTALTAPALTLSPVFVLDRAIQAFLMQRNLSIEQFAALRQLIETAQHYWDVDARLRKTESDWPTLSEAIANFIQLLRSGVIASYPYLAGNQHRSALVLANSFQYLNARLQHPWQYWLDAGSQLWQYGGEVELWGASLFLPESAESALFYRDRMSATLTELIHRTQSRLYLCHSELAVSGQSQMGPLMPWIEAAPPDTLIGESIAYP
jgi:hypothetical protein